jgi:hypothetical protein
MSNQNRLAPRSEKGLLTPDNCVVALIDLQALWGLRGVGVLRQHERITIGDQDVETQAHRYHVGPDAPLVSHRIAIP